MVFHDDCFLKTKILNITICSCLNRWFVLNLLYDNGVELIFILGIVFIRRLS